MSISFPVKVTFGVLAGGATVAGGTLIYREVSKSDVQSKEDKSKKSVADLIKNLNKNKRLMNKVQDGNSKEGKEGKEGKEAGKLYLTDYKNSNENPFSLNKAKPESEPSGNDNAPDEFMNKCESFSKEMVVDDKDDKYKNVLRYCTRDALVKDLILESGRDLIDVSNGDGSESWKDYRKVNSGKTNKGDTWQLTDWDTKKNDDNTISEDLKKKCESKLADKTEGKVSDDYKNIVNGCSKLKGK